MPVRARLAGPGCRRVSRTKMWYPLGAPCKLDTILRGVCVRGHRSKNTAGRLGHKPIAALWMSMGSPSLVELAGAAQPDAIVIDMQHGLFDRTTLEYALGAVPNGVSTLVRVAENSIVAIGQALDAGAEGVIIPLVETDSEAALAVAAARFPPVGRRSGGGVRPLSSDFGAYCAASNERTVVGVMIETERGVSTRRRSQDARPRFCTHRKRRSIFVACFEFIAGRGCLPQILQVCRAAGVPAPSLPIAPNRP